MPRIKVPRYVTVQQGNDTDVRWYRDAATSGGVKSRIVKKLKRELSELLQALHRARILADTILNMLRSSLRSANGRLFRGSCSSLAPSTCPWGMASMISHRPSSFKLHAATLQYKQKRGYKNAVEETNKGVVSGLFT